MNSSLNHTRITILTTAFYPETHGGIESHVFSLAKLLRDNSCQVQIVHVSPLINHFSRSQQSGIRVLKIPALGWHSALAFFNLHYLYAALYQSQIVHLHDPCMGTLSLMTIFFRYLGLAHYKIVFSTHGFWFHNHNKRRILSQIAAPAYRIYSRFILGVCNGIICVSQQDQILLSSEFPFSKKLVLKSSLIPNPVDTHRFNTAGSSIPISGKSSGLNIICLSRNSPHKNLDLVVSLLEAASRNVGMCISLHLVGEGTTSLSNGFSSDSSFFNLKCYGSISDLQVELIASSCMFAISLSSYEGFGLAILELMAIGLVPIVSDICAHSYVKKCKLGLSIDITSPPSQMILELSTFLSYYKDPLSDSYSDLSTRSKIFACEKSWANSSPLFANNYLTLR